jgi:hypothetical protein
MNDNDKEIIRLMHENGRQRIEIARLRAALADTMNELHAWENNERDTCIRAHDADANTVGLDWCRKHNSRWDISYYSKCDVAREQT